MPFTYQADVLCDDCGRRVIAELELTGQVPANPSDESSFDSDVYPKSYSPDSEQADSPQNCATGECGGWYMHTDGVSTRIIYYGRFLENGLTEDGYKSLKAMLDDHGATLPKFAQEWADFYQFAYFNNPWSSAHEWLSATIQDHAAQIEDRDGGNTHAAALVSLCNDLTGKLDGDEIQDLFQSDMENDDYFKQTGWYSPEME